MHQCGDHINYTLSWWLWLCPLNLCLVPVVCQKKKKELIRFTVSFVNKSLRKHR